MPSLLPAPEAEIPQLPSNQFLIVSMVLERIHKRGQGRDPEALRLILEDEDAWEAPSLSTSVPPRVCD